MKRISKPGTIEFLNKLLEMDKAAVTALINQRVPCNQALAEHPTVQVTPVAAAGATAGEAPIPTMQVGLLGILNGLVLNGKDDRPIRAVYSRDDATGDLDLLRFEEAK